MTVRAIRGATTASIDSKEEIELVVTELMREILSVNKLQEEDLISVLFTATKDLRSIFPASAARVLGFGDTPLICAQELDIEGALPRTIRVLVHAHSSKEKSEIVHVYLRDAIALRKDLTR